MTIGPVGVWSHALRFGDPGRAVEAADELDDLGYAALWIPDIGGEVFERVERLLEATRRAVVATGILNIWMHDPALVAREHARLDEQYPERFVLGLGIGHAHRDVGRALRPAEHERMQLDFTALVEAQDRGRYDRPLATMRSYLDALDAEAPRHHEPARVLAALRPKMAALAGERTLGIHPYLVPPEHAHQMRELLGPNRLIATAVAAVLETDRARAFEIARADVSAYLGLPNYTNAWRQLGFSEADLAGTGSDRLIEELYAWGSPEDVAATVQQHHDAGADHVCVRVVGGDEFPLQAWRELALALATDPAGSKVA